MFIELVLWLVAIVVAVALTAFLLRRARSATYRELKRRVSSGEIVAGVPANWLEGRSRLRWSGCLVVTADGFLHWEPDRTSMSKRQATPIAWHRTQLRLDVISSGRGFTGERYERVEVAVADVTVATFGVFDEVGPWHQELTLPRSAQR